jgi:transposase-like protein
MDAEAQAQCGAPFGASAPERVNQRNGSRSRRWDTRVGSIELAVPKLRKGRNRRIDAEAYPYVCST